MRGQPSMTPLTDTVFSVMTREVCPRSPEAPVRVDAIKALRQLEEDLQLLSAAPVGRLDEVVRKFASQVRARRAITGEPLASVFDSTRVSDFVAEHVPGGVDDTLPLTYRRGNLAQPLIDRLRTEAKSELDSSVIELLQIVSEVMTRCRQSHRLSYHTIWHAFLVMGMSIINVMERGCNSDYALFLGLMSLTHDVFYRFARGGDEELSAELFLLLTDHLFKSSVAGHAGDGLGAGGGVTEKQYFSAMVRVVLRFGTLPIVHAKDKRGEPGVPDFSCLKMQSAVEFYLQYNPAVLRSPGLREVMLMARAIGDADIHSSLNPKGFIERFPLCDGFNIESGLAARTQEGSLLWFIEQYYLANRAAIRAPYAEYKVCCLLKFMQSGCYIVENPVKKGSAERQEARYATHVKMDRKLQGEEVAFTNDDLRVFAGILGEADEPGLIDGELFFAGMQLRGAMPAGGQAVLESLPQYEAFYPESWQWHDGILKQVSAYVRDDSRSVPSRAQVLSDLLTVAGNQPGKHFSLTAFKRLVGRSRPMVTMTSSTARIGASTRVVCWSDGETKEEEVGGPVVSRLVTVRDAKSRQSTIGSEPRGGSSRPKEKRSTRSSWWCCFCRRKKVDKKTAVVVPGSAAEKTASPV